MQKIKFILSSILLVTASQVYAADTVNDAAIKIKWGYSGNTSAVHWGSLSPDFALCSEGKSQSPIDITDPMTNSSSNLSINYHAIPMTIVDDGITELTIGSTKTIINDGHGVQLNFPADRASELITYNGKTYRLIQFHIHTPSENKVHGEGYPMEIHFVHQGDNGQLAVIGVFVKEGQQNPTLQKIITHLPKEEGKAITIPGETINPADLLPSKHDYYSFDGSLTTPPCSEGLQWLVMSEPIIASREQIARLKEAANGANARPLQALNKRSVSYIKANSPH